jgi:hypothetical protein
MAYQENYQEMTLVQLRELASIYKIRNRSKMNKFTLVNALYARDRRREFDRKVFIQMNQLVCGMMHITEVDIESGFVPTSFINYPGAPVCSVCIQNESNTVYVECGHMVCCMSCATKLDKCPICRKQGHWIKVFTS